MKRHDKTRNLIKKPSGKKSVPYMAKKNLEDKKKNEKNIKK